MTMHVDTDDLTPAADQPGQTGLSQLTALLEASGTAPLDPERVVTALARAVPRAIACALTLGRPGAAVRTLTATGDVAHRIEVLQTTTGEGPALDEAAAGHVVRVDDLATASPWPEFGPRCVTVTGVRSLISVHLHLHGTDRSALGLYFSEPYGFDAGDLAAAVLFAPVAALAVQTALYAKDAESLHEALQTSRLIGTAIGIVMEREHLTSEAAFALLVRASQNRNRKLRDIAADVGFTGMLPPEPEAGAPPV